MFEFAILRDGEPAHVFSLGASAVLVGRGGGNDIRTGDPSVSWQHAMFFVEAGRMWVRDLGSSNGTYLHDERIRGPQVLRNGDQVRLGAGTLIVARYLGDGPVDPPSGLSIQDQASGIGTPIVSDRVRIGSGADCDLRIEGLPAHAATVIVHADGEVWLGTDQDERPLELGAPFLVAGRALVIRHGAGVRDSTVVPDPDRYPYRVSAWLEGATGPEARVEDLSTSRVYRCEVGNRAILLYLLAKKVHEDRKDGRSFNETGWCSDEDIMSKVWGRHGDANKLHVLLHRLRADVRDAGLDPWFIEKKQRFVRIRVAEVGLAPPK